MPTNSWYGLKTPPPEKPFRVLAPYLARDEEEGADRSFPF